MVVCRPGAPDIRHGADSRAESDVEDHEINGGHVAPRRLLNDADANGLRFPPPARQGVNGAQESAPVIASLDAISASVSVDPTAVASEPSKRTCSSGRSTTQPPDDGNFVSRGMI